MKKLSKRNKPRLSMGGEKLEDRYLMHGGADTSIDFEDLAPTAHYVVGDVFAADDTGVQASIRAEPFQWSGGTVFGGGSASVDHSQLAGHVGQDIQLNNITAAFDFGSPVDGLSLNFGEYGGNLNVRINGDFYNVENFADLDGQVTADGVLIVVPTGGFGNDRGELVLRGVVDTFQVGGQELWVDHVHPGEVVDVGHPHDTEECIDFEDLTATKQYFVGDTFQADNTGLQADIDVHRFFFSDGTPFGRGFTQVDTAGLAGHLGQDMMVNNVNLDFDFGTSLGGLSLNFGEYGGNLNISINGVFQNFEDFQDIHGAVFGGVAVTVPAGGFGNDVGRLVLSGTIDSFAVGGQELWIDHVCVRDTDDQDRLDWGDAPDQPYRTLAVNAGAHHRIEEDVFLGDRVDPEPNGQPTLASDGDDTSLTDDEDGVKFITPLIPGQPAEVEVVASIDGWLNAWIDFNQNGVWEAGPENIFSGQLAIVGSNILNFNVPADAVPNERTYSRWRFSTTDIVLPPWQDGSVATPNGEVEDHLAFIEEQPERRLDWGDAPDQPYRTLAVNAGAHHRIEEDVFLGDRVDPEPNGQPTLASDGDDTSLTDDEDGVKFITPLIPGQPAEVEVVASIDGWLNAWIDFNQNGVWEAGPENIFSGQLIFVGPNILNFNVPADAVPNERTYSRWRFSTTDIVLPPWQDGSVATPNGEVEDHLAFIEEQPEERLDWGDAPDQPYPTLAVNNGARHRIIQGYHLGRRIDADPNGQPTIGALGDDLDGSDDDDGVRFLTTIVPGGVTKVAVDATADGLLDAWADFNQDGVWQPREQIFANEPLVAGTNLLAFAVPNHATPNPLEPTYLRFRFSRAGGLTPVGPAASGEVEDYAVLRGDVNENGTIDADDLDLLWEKIANGSDDPLLDLNGDGDVDSEDHAVLVQEILGTNYGDANLDGKVDAGDLNIVGLNWQTPTGGWSNGDFNCDGKVDAADLNLLGLHWRAGGGSRAPRAPLAAGAAGDGVGEAANVGGQASQPKAVSDADERPTSRRQEGRNLRSTLARRGHRTGDLIASPSNSAWSDKVDNTFADWAAV